MMTANPKYNMSFTSGALLYRESLILIQLYGQLGDWPAVRAHVLAENSLQMRTVSSSKRVFREVRSRLQQLTPAEVDLLSAGSRQEQVALLWLAICKRYRFIHEFAVTVLREKFLRLDFDLAYADYDTFFYDRAEWHPEVERVAVSTRKKQREIVFRMLREAELLSKQNRIMPVLLSQRLLTVVAADDPAHLAIFPMPANAIRERTS